MLPREVVNAWKYSRSGWRGCDLVEDVSVLLEGVELGDL